MEIIKYLIILVLQRCLPGPAMMHKVIEYVGAKFINVGVEQAASVDARDLFHEGKLASLNVEGEGVDRDAGLGAAKYLGHRFF
jgi:hypothetical protein